MSLVLANDEKDRYEVLLVYPGEVPALRELVTPALERAIENSEGEETAEHVLDLVEMDSVRMFLVYDRENLAGVGIAEQILTVKGIWLNIPFLFCNKNLGAFRRLTDTIEKFAMDTKHRGLKMITTVDKLGTYARRKGYRMRFIEWVREFE